MSLTVSNLGGASYTRIVGSISSTAAPQSHPMRANKTLMEDSPYLANLTVTDLEIVYQATGVRMDENSKTYPLFAVTIAMDRESGALSAGQNLSTDYLTEMLRMHTGQVDADWLLPQIERALDYLAGRGGAPGVDVLA